MRKSQHLLTLGLVAILIVASCAWVSIVRLRNQVQRLESHLHQLTSRVTREMADVSGTVQKMRDETRWWTPDSMEVLKADRDGAMVRISWRLREYRAGNEVALHYRLSGAEYETTAAEEDTDGRFQAVVPVPIPGEPLIHVQVEKTATVDRKGQRVSVESAGHASGGLGLTYYVSVSDGTTTITGDEHHLDLGKLSYGLFSQLDAWFRVDEDDGQVSLKIVEHGHTKTVYDLEAVRLEIRDRDDEGRVIDSWPVSQAAATVDSQTVAYNASLSVDAVRRGLACLVLHYSDGITIERPISEL